MRCRQRMDRKKFVLAVVLVFVWLVAGGTGGGQEGHQEHGAHGPEVAEKRFQAELSVAGPVEPGAGFTATIHIRDAQGRSVDAFEVFHEKLLHLIIVSEDLGFFSHLHPEYLSKGNFAVKTSLPLPGLYSLFCDYKPVGQPEQLSLLKLRVAGVQPPPAAIDTEKNRRTVSGVTVRLRFVPSPLRAARESMAAFSLEDGATGRPVADLTPYLGEKGHLVVIRQSPSLAEADYIHTHALKEGPDSEAWFMMKLPLPGIYRMWGQFSRGGEIVTADFGVKAEP